MSARLVSVCRSSKTSTTPGWSARTVLSCSSSGCPRPSAADRQQRTQLDHGRVQVARRPSELAREPDRVIVRGSRSSQTNRRSGRDAAHCDSSTVLPEPAGATTSVSGAPAPRRGAREGAAGRRRAPVRSAPRSWSAFSLSHPPTAVNHPVRMRVRRGSQTSMDHNESARIGGRRRYDLARLRSHRARAHESPS